MDVITQTEKAARFLALHRPGEPLLLPNPWDLGSARVLAWMGFQALATTSSGFAMTLGRPDGPVTRDEALEHGRVIASATGLPVSADLEGGFADEPAGVASVWASSPGGRAGRAARPCWPEPCWPEPCWPRAARPGQVRSRPTAPR